MRLSLRRKLQASVIAIAGIVTMLALVFSSQQSLQGQSNGILPWVVSTNPARGDELSIDQAVKFVFNVPMDRASVQAALSVTPAAPGIFRWQNDTTVSFKPNRALDRETAYIFTIDSGAKSREGVKLRDTFSLKLHTTGYLAVTQFFPEDGAAGVELQPTLMMVFNRPVVPLGTAEQMQKMPAPFKAEPQMTGKGEWLTTSIYHFEVTSALKSSTDYKITVPATLTDVSGSRLKEASTFHFKTVYKAEDKPQAFSVYYFSPEKDSTDVFRSPLIRVGFTAPADVESAKAGFSLLDPYGRVIPGKFEWNEKNNELQFRPSELLDYSTSYTVNIDRKGVHSTQNVPLATDASITFTTVGLPEITATSPNDGSLVDPYAEVNIAFSTPMKLNDIADRIEVLPKVPNVVLDADLGPDSTSARIQFSTLPSTTYTITVNTKGMVDIWGTPIQVKPKNTVYKIVDSDKIQFRYVTSALGPAVSLETDGQAMGLYNAYHQTRVFVTHRNIGTVGMTLYSLPTSVFLNAPDGNNTDPMTQETESLIRRWVVPVYNPQNIMRYDLLSITNDGTSIGQQGNIVCVEAAPSILAVGQTVRVVRKEVPNDDNVTPTAPAPINVRNEPGTQNSAIVAQAPNGTDFTVLDGPVCADHYVWWQVQSEDGKLNGWIPEGDLKQPYVIPLTDPANAATPAATVAPTLPPVSTEQATPAPALQSGQLAPGIYRLEMEALEITNDSHHVQHVMLIATDNVTLKISQHEAVAWITDLKSGKPAVGQTVQFFRRMQIQANVQRIVPYGKLFQTDSDGLATMTVTEEMNPANEVIYAVVTTPGHFGIAASTWAQGIDASDFQQPTMFNSEDMALYLYSDRRLYRPGEKVYFKGTIRQRNDAVYSLSDKKLIPVDVIDPFNEVIYSKKLPVNEYGSFSDSFTIDNGAHLGEYQIVARPNKPDPTPSPTPTEVGRPLPTPTAFGSPVPVQDLQDQAQPNDPQFITEITVADYTPPEFQVSVKPESPHVSPGDSIRATVESSYYFGGPVSDAVVQWELRSDPYYFFYSGSGNYSFEDYNQDQIAQDYEDDRPQITSSGAGKTDDQGRYTIDIPAVLGPGHRSLIYTIEALVWDQSNQSVAERGQVVVDQGQFEVGVGVDNYVGTVNENQNIQLIAVNPDSTGIPKQKLNVRIVRRVWDSVQTIEPGTGRTVWENDVVEKPVSDGFVFTDANGKATYSFLPLTGGAYKVYASGVDAKGNTIQSSTFVWIAGPDFVSWREPNSNRIDLQADKTSYKVGDTASILIPTPFQGPATALITVERGSIIKHIVMTLESNSTIYKLPITPDMAPDAFFSVTVIKGEDAHNLTSAFRTGLIQLNVDTDQMRLNVDVKSDRQKVGPGGQVTFKLHVTNYKGDPVKAEVGLALVDQAVLSLLPDDLPSLMSYFYSRQGLGVRTANSLIYNIDQTTQEIINVQKGGGKGGNDYFGIFTVRQNFVTTPLWKPFVTTNSQGDATVTVTMPDQLTTWVLDARAHTLPMGDTKTTLVGQTVQSLVTTKPLLIRPEVPRFYVVGDSSTLSAIVNNNTDQDQEVQTSVDITGASVKGDVKQYATIPANSRLKFDWPITIQDTTAVDMTFKVVTKDGKYLDAAKPVTAEGDIQKVPVLRYETPDVVTTGGVIGNEGGIRTEGLVVPTPAPNAGKDDTLQIRVDRSLASSAAAALKTLDIYPYYCIEQTVSRFLPDAVMYHAEKALGIKDATLESNLTYTLETAMQRIYADQQTDGGWGWFVSDSSDQLISAYTVLGLAEAKAAGYQVDNDVFSKSVEALRRSLIDVDDKTAVWDLNRQAFILYVLARASQEDVNGNQSKDYFDVSRSIKLFDQRDRMNLDALAFLAMDFDIIEPGSGYHVVPLMDTVKKAAKFSLTGRHWEESFLDMWNWTTDTRTTAIVLKALVETEPTSPLIPDTVRWLMTARQFDKWETTQETAWSVMALSAWMKQTGDLKPDYKFNISVNDKKLTKDESATADNVRTPYDLKLSVSDLLSNEVNKVAIQRSAGDGTLYYSAQLTTYLPVEQIKALSRGIIIQRSYSLENDKAHAPITWASVGDQIRVTLTIVVPQSLNYVAIEDPIPAGTQQINTSFQTSQKLDLTSPLQYGWTYWVFTHQELRDDRTVLYAPYLPQGTYQFIYQIRAGVPGTYHVIPANGHAFYQPEIFGRTDGQLFTLLPAGQEKF